MIKILNKIFRVSLIGLAFIWSGPVQAQIPFYFYSKPESSDQTMDSSLPKQPPPPPPVEHRVPPPPYPNYYVIPYTNPDPDIANPNLANPNIANPHIPTPNIAKPNVSTPNVSYEGMQFMGLKD